MQSVEFG